MVGFRGSGDGDRFTPSAFRLRLHDSHSDLREISIKPGSLHCVARRAKTARKRVPGHSGRDDRERKSGGRIDLAEKGAACCVPQQFGRFCLFHGSMCFALQFQKPLNIGFMLLTRRNDLRSLRFDKVFGWQSFSNCSTFPPSFVVRRLFRKQSWHPTRR